ncbi:unnamed protein product, partial [Pedinophyceae sp. YPF-701]
APQVGKGRDGKCQRNWNKNKRLFSGEPGGLKHGERVFYQTAQGETLLEGVVQIEPDGNSGIHCACCQKIVSCSQFENHAGRGSRRAPYDNIYSESGVSLRILAMMLPDLPNEGGSGSGSGGSGEGGADGGSGCATGELGAGEPEEEEDVQLRPGEAGGLNGGCVLCRTNTFTTETFNDETMIICDQCDREFHVGCLRKWQRAWLEKLPSGRWFCSPACRETNKDISSVVSRGDMPITEWHSWQVMQGKNRGGTSGWDLRAVLKILQESFDPIMDLSTNTDLLPIMVQGGSHGDYDYSSVYTMALRFRGKPVVAAVFRVFGEEVAELPLIATKSDARREGHARVLMNIFEELLVALGVRRLALPAASETVDTWARGFGFQHMAPEELLNYKREFRLLIFPGTHVMYKELLPPAKRRRFVPTAHLDLQLVVGVEGGAERVRIEYSIRGTWKDVGLTDPVTQPERTESSDDEQRGRRGGARTHQQRHAAAAAAVAAAAKTSTPNRHHPNGPASPQGVQHAAEPVPRPMGDSPPPVELLHPGIKEWALAAGLTPPPLPPAPAGEAKPTPPQLPRATPPAANGGERPTRSSRQAASSFDADADNFIVGEGLSEQEQDWMSSGPLATRDGLGGDGMGDLGLDMAFD